MEENLPSPSDEHKLLQGKFLKIVDKMRETNTPLPLEFAVFYRVMIQADRKGKAVAIRPFLTEDQAFHALGYDEEWEGKYGRSVKWDVVDCGNQVNLENTLASDEELSEEQKDIPLWTNHDAVINVSN
ncbi:hypothetical protein A9K97_gp034 [Tokyovirus A1]|uniref:hypothetical protein n=1 Tax=Tokyovirus A1 TaxID=1826170 RepID=UPI0007A9857B|nr:hypothetical protein A9K97_gp034 [Tokyovirus A1]BAU80317.1 hypothetical protein [Tokyovirus A1]